MLIEKRYSIVCYLEGSVCEKVRTLQEKLFELTGSRKCLDAWMPHITIGSGIIVPNERQEEADSAFRKIADEQYAFTIALRGFGGTEEWKGAKVGITTPYVLWVNPVMTDQLLGLFTTVADEITFKYETFYPRIVEYVPHVTVAYGDLTKAGYEKGKEFLNTIDFIDEMVVSHVALVENFPDKDVEYRRFNFHSS